MLDEERRRLRPAAQLQLLHIGVIECVRKCVAMLRQGAGKGRKVLWVWDKAGVDFAFWQERKASGIYFLSLRKAGLCLTVEKERVIDATQPINQGVTADRVVVDRRGIRVREITFHNPCDGAG